MSFREERLPEHYVNFVGDLETMKGFNTASGAFSTKRFRRVKKFKHCNASRKNERFSAVL